MHILVYLYDCEFCVPCADKGLDSLGNSEQSMYVAVVNRSGKGISPTGRDLYLVDNNSIQNMSFECLMNNYFNFDVFPTKYSLFEVM